MRSVLPWAFALLVIGATHGSRAHAESAPRPSDVTTSSETPTGAGEPATSAAAPSIPAATIPATTPSAEGSQLSPPRAVARSEPYRPSGFWTSGRPAQGGAYRYRLLLIGLVVALGMLAFLIWLIRSHRPSSQWQASDSETV